MLFWILLLVLSILAYALLVILVLPNFLLKTNYPIAHSDDRGLKKYRLGESDHAIVYEPSLSARKYIPQYVIAKRDGKKTIQCKIAASVSYIDFDIYLFDAQQNCFSVMHSMDIRESNGLTKETELPSETAYAGILVNQVNDQRLRKEDTATVKVSRICAYGILVLMLSIGMSVCSLYAFSNVFGGLFRESFANQMIRSGWVFILPTIISAVSISGACFTLFKRTSKR